MWWCHALASMAWILGWVICAFIQLLHWLCKIIFIVFHVKEIIGIKGAYIVLSSLSISTIFDDRMRDQLLLLRSLINSSLITKMPQFVMLLCHIELWPFGSMYLYWSFDASFLKLMSTRGLICLLHGQWLYICELLSILSFFTDKYALYHYHS